MSDSKSAIIIGSGIGGLGTAALLAKSGYAVTVLEKNSKLGGRANVFEAEGFRFDMGPSWYLMPDVFEHFFQLMGEQVSDHLQLTRLDPSYRIFFKDQGLTLDFCSDVSRDIKIFEDIEPGSGEKLLQYLEASEFQYHTALEHFMYKNYDTVFDFFNKITAVEGRKLSVFQSMDKYVAKYFESDVLRKVMEYQLVFLGSSPFNTPALYNIMSHIDFNMGVFYPQGGIYSIVEALVSLGRKHGVQYLTDTPVQSIEVEGGEAKSVVLPDESRLTADVVVSNADIHHTETKLLPARARSYSDRYWKSRTLAPSGFIMYLGVKGRVPSLTHHNLLFCKDWKQNFGQIFDTPMVPDDPSYYVCAPSVTDPNLAPPDCENLFVLVPIAPSVTFTDAEREEYSQRILASMEKEMSIPNLRDRIIFKRLYTSENFTLDYNSFGGSALGYAHTLKQTAIFRANNVSKKVKNLYYAGAGTNPGIGVPICLISAEMAYKRIAGIKDHRPLRSLTEELGRNE